MLLSKCCWKKENSFILQILALIHNFFSCNLSTYFVKYIVAYKKNSKKFNFIVLTVVIRTYVNIFHCSFVRITQSCLIPSSFCSSFWLSPVCKSGSYTFIGVSLIFTRGSKHLNKTFLYVVLVRTGWKMQSTIVPNLWSNVKVMCGPWQWWFYLHKRCQTVLSLELHLGISDIRS